MDGKIYLGNYQSTLKKTFYFGNICYHFLLFDSPNIYTNYIYDKYIVEDSLKPYPNTSSTRQAAKDNDNNIVAWDQGWRRIVSDEIETYT